MSVVTWFSAAWFNRLTQPAEFDTHFTILKNELDLPHKIHPYFIILPEPSWCDYGNFPFVAGWIHITAAVSLDFLCDFKV